LKKACRLQFGTGKEPEHLWRVGRKLMYSSGNCMVEVPRALQKQAPKLYATAASGFWANSPDKVLHIGSYNTRSNKNILWERRSARSVDVSDWRAVFQQLFNGLMQVSSPLPLNDVGVSLAR